jgi:anti-sigma regulatory factor (Ser/Thr protein kinase)
MKKPVVTELRLPNRPGFELVAMSAVASVAELMHFSNERIVSLKAAVGEAWVNAMEHGDQIVVLISMGEESLEVSFSDVKSPIIALH